MRFGFVLPLPAFVLHPLTSVFLAGLHLYLAAGHLSPLLGGDVQWMHIWKSFGALGGVYVFAALASKGLARREGRDGDQRQERDSWQHVLTVLPDRDPASSERKRRHASQQPVADGAHAPPLMPDTGR